MRCAARVSGVVSAGLVSAALAAGTGAGAQAQSSCGESVTVTLGDTLHSIAERCGTSVAAVVGANPGISDPNLIEVGQDLTIPGSDEDQAGAADTAEPEDGGYRAESGETLSSVADGLGTTAQAVIAANPGLDPQNIPIGRILDPPLGDAPDEGARPGAAAVAVSARQAAPGERISVRASGFPAGAPVEIGVGPPQSEFEVVARARTDDRGRLRQGVEVPGWAAQHRSLVFVAQTPDARIRATSEPLAMAAGPGGGDDSATVRVTGRMIGGAECPALSGDDGNVYSLAMPDRGQFRIGDRVEVQGSEAEASSCMRGTTIEVRSIRQTP